MENIIKFEPLFASAERVLLLPREAVHEVRAAALDVYLNEVENELDAVRDVAEHTMVVIRALLSKNNPRRAKILRILAAAGYNISGDPILLIVAMISQWFQEVSPYFNRVVNFEPGSDSKFGNLGFLSMLLATENWKEIPECGSSKLRYAVVVANSVTTVVCGAFVMFRGFGPEVGESWDKSLKLTPPSVCIWAYLKSSWQVARTGGKVWANGGPGVQFNANAEEIRMRTDGKRLLVKFGRVNWQDPAYWHPCKQIPGSPWNKFLKNKNQPIFEPSSEEYDSQIMHRLPSTAIKFAEIFEELYETIYEEMDERKFARRELNAVESSLQHNRLATDSGLWYPDEELGEHDATELYTVVQDYSDVVPLAKRPTTDSSGHLTIPFLASATRALKLNQEPEPIEEDLWVMTVGGIEAGDVSH